MMGYSINAILGCKSALQHLTEDFINTKTINLYNDLYIIPMTDELFDEINKFIPSNSIGNFTLLNERISKLLADASQNSMVAYFEAEYFGGLGNQSSVVWKYKEVVFIEEHSQDAFNKSLKIMGIKNRKDNFDEFKTVGLDRCRHTEKWLELD